MPPLIHEQTTNLLTANVNNQQQFEDCSARIKCVLIGDGAIGKTSLVVSYTTNGYPTEYVPTAFDNYNVMVTVDNQPMRFQLCDTAGQDDFDSLRPLCYPGTDVFLLCFSVVSPTSFYNVRDKWLPEIRHHCPGAPVVLVGTQCDLRSDVKVLIELNSYREHPVHEKQARRLAQQIGAISYLECSALTQKNLKEVFDTAILVTIQKKKKWTEKARGQHQHQQMTNGGSPSVSKRNNHYSPAAAIARENASCRNKFNARIETEEERRLARDKSNAGWKKLCCFS